MGDPTTDGQTATRRDAATQKTMARTTMDDEFSENMLHGHMPCIHHPWTPPLAHLLAPYPIQTQNGGPTLKTPRHPLCMHDDDMGAVVSQLCC